MNRAMTINEIRSFFPDEWVLLGNPVLDEFRTGVVSGIPIYHSKDKKEVCYLGRDKTENYSKIKLIYTGTIKHSRIITGIFNRVN